MGTQAYKNFLLQRLDHIREGADNVLAAFKIDLMKDATYALESWSSSIVETDYRNTRIIQMLMKMEQGESAEDVVRAEVKNIEEALIGIGQHLPAQEYFPNSSNIYSNANNLIKARSEGLWLREVRRLASAIESFEAQERINEYKKTGEYINLAFSDFSHENIKKWSRKRTPEKLQEIYALCTSEIVSIWLSTGVTPSRNEVWDKVAAAENLPQLAE